MKHVKQFLTPGWLGLVVAVGALAVSVLGYLEGQETRRLQEAQWAVIRAQALEQAAQDRVQQLRTLSGLIDGGRLLWESVDLEPSDEFLQLATYQNEECAEDRTELSR